MNREILKWGVMPRLMVVVEKSSTLPEKQVGFLYLEGLNRRKEVAVGDAGSREFRLIQCLFSPKNFLSAKYQPVAQTRERIFGAIREPTDALNARLADRDSSESEMNSIVGKVIQKIQKGESGKYLSFISFENKVRMEASLPPERMAT